MGGRALGHLGPSGGCQTLFGGSPYLRSIFGGPTLKEGPKVEMKFLIGTKS